MIIYRTFILFLSLWLNISSRASVPDVKTAEEANVGLLGEPIKGAADITLRQQLGMGNQLNDYQTSRDIAILLESGRNESIHRNKPVSLGLVLVDLLRQKPVPIIVSGVILHNVLIGGKLFLQNAKIKGSTEQKLDELVQATAPVRLAENKLKSELENALKASESKITPLQAEEKKIGDKLLQLHHDSEQKIALENRKNAISNEIFKTKNDFFNLSMDISKKKIVHISDNQKLHDAFMEIWQAPQGNKIINHYLYAHTNFKFEEWDVYKHNAAELYLLIPKDYDLKIWHPIAQKEKEIIELAVKLQITQQEAILGLNVGRAKIVTKIKSLKELESTLSATWDSPSMKRFGRSAALDFIFSKAFPEYHTINLEALESFFVADKRLPWFWNIYLGGHGLHAESIDSKKQLEQTSGHVAGLTNSQFANFLKFIIQKINTTFLEISTCYAGGYNLSLIAQYGNMLQEKNKTDKEEAKIIQESNAKNIFVSSAIADSPTFGSAVGLEQLYEFTQTGQLLPFKQYFNALHQLKNVQPNNLDEKLKEILSLIMDWQARGNEDLHGISGVPSVWYPGLKQPKAIEVGDKVLVVTNKQKGQDIVDKKALLIYPKMIDFPLNIIVGADWNAKSPAIIPMSPENTITTFAAISIKVKGVKKKENEINEKAAQDPQYLEFDRFLVESIFQLKSVFKKRYFIKKLLVKNYDNSGILDSNKNQNLELEDVAIKKSVATSKILYKIASPKALFEHIKGQVLFKVKDNKGVYVYYIGEWDDEGFPKKIKEWKRIDAAKAIKEYKKYME